MSTQKISSLWMKAFVGSAGGVAGVAGLVWYDKKTAHPMRQMQPYKWQEGWIRFSNWMRLQFTVTLNEMTLEDLSRYDGKGDQCPTYFASDGLVWDVSESAIFRDSYGLWRGKEASVALAKMSLDPSDVNRTDWGTLNDKELESLHSWTKYFLEKYPIVGRLQGFSIPEKPVKHPHQ